MPLTRKVFSLALLCLAASVAHAQRTTNSIVGEVQGPNGATLPGVTVTAHHLESDLVREVVTGVDGEFIVAALPLGTYEVRATIDGFRPVVQRPIHLELGTTVVLRLTLDVGAAEDEITVVADFTGVQTRSGELSFLVDEDQIRDLPLNGRNYTDLVFLQPGVIAFPYRDGGSVVAHGLGASINGQDPRSNVYLLDGTLMNDFTNSPAGSAASTALGTEMVHEFRVETNTYSAEYGRNYGGQINVITKSGSNDLHGSVFEYHRNDALDARDYFDGDEKPDFRRNQFGFTLGGPIRKGRTFFFVGYEGLRERLGRTIQTVVPNEASRLGVLPDPARPGGTIQVPVDPAVRPYLDEYPLPNGAELGGGLAAYTFPFSQDIDQNYFQVRLDQNVGRSDQLFVRYTYDDADQLLPTDFPQFPRTFLSTNQFLTAEYRRSVSSRTLATFRFGYSRTRIGQDVEANTLQPLPPFVPGRPVARGHRHRGHSALRAADLRRRLPASGRLLSPGRPPPEPREAHRHRRRSRGAVPQRRVQPDVQPGALRLRESRGLPREPPPALHRPHAGGRPGAELALDPARGLRAGPGPARGQRHRERGPAPRVRDPARGAGGAGHQHARSPRPRDHRGSALRQPRPQSLTAAELRLGRLRRRAHRAARRLRPVLQQQRPAEPHRHHHQPAVHAPAGDPSA